MIHWLVYFLYLFGLAVARALPIETIFRFGEVLGRCAFWILPRRRKLVLGNLSRAFGNEKSGAEIRRLAQDHFRLLGANLFSCLKLETMSGAEIRKRVTLDVHLAVPPANERRGWIAMISHLGNWELFGRLAEIFPEFRFGAIYHPLANRLIDADIAQRRRGAGLTLFDRRAGYLRCVKFLREGGALGVLVDQFAGVAGVWVPLFGRLTSTSQLAATLALRADAEVVPIGIYTTGRARWTVVTLDPIPSSGSESAELAAQMNDHLEALIRRHPADWLWSHDRWKTPQPRFLLAQDWRRFSDERRALQPFRILIRAPDERVEGAACIAAIRAIKASRPDAWVAVAASDLLVELFAEFDGFIALHSGDSPFAVARKIRATAAFDAAIIFPDSWRAALAIRLAGVPCRAGCPRRLFLNYWHMEPAEAPPPDAGSERYLRMAEVLGAVVTR